MSVTTVQKRGRICGFNRYLYYAKKAQEQYKTMLRESREGIPLNKESFYQMDKVLTLGIQKKQSIYHIIQTHNLPVSKATVYRHAKLGYLTAKPIDFPRMVKFKENLLTTSSPSPSPLARTSLLFWVANLSNQKTHTYHLIY